MKKPVFKLNKKKVLCPENGFPKPLENYE